jgi:predicted alpha/beta-fold hydrolase
MEDNFRAPWWGRNPHVQTLLPRLVRRRLLVNLRRERVEMPDGDFLDLDWLRPPAADDRRPIVVIMHGLEGNSASPYAQGMLAALAARQWPALVMHFRGCSGELNRLPRAYHSGDTGDAAAIFAILRARYPRVPLAAVGYSLGGNVLLKHLGEQGASTVLAAAVAISVPFLLSECADRLQQGFSRFYQKALLASLVQKTRAKFAILPCPIPDLALDAIATIRDFDEHLTAPLHGFKSAADYYARSSCRQYLRGITVPTLIVQSADDPFLTPAVIPSPKELSATTQLQLSAHGGHVGFIYGPHPWRVQHWLEERVPDFLSQHIEPANSPA